MRYVAVDSLYEESGGGGEADVLVGWKVFSGEQLVPFLDEHGAVPPGLLLEAAAQTAGALVERFRRRKGLEHGAPGLVKVEEFGIDRRIGAAELLEIRASLEDCSGDVYAVDVELAVGGARIGGGRVLLAAGALREVLRDRGAYEDSMRRRSLLLAPQGGGSTAESGSEGEV